MNFLGLDFEVKNIPLLDESFVPLAAFSKAYLTRATKPFAIALERENGFISVFDTRIIDDPAYEKATLFYIERTLKAMLWLRGGFCVYACGDSFIGEYLKKVYAADGERAFDFNFMSDIYERNFEIKIVPYEERPLENECSMPVGRHLDGCRIGFDAGGSDRKVSAVVNGEPVFSEEVVWFPKTNSDPKYHFDGIVEAMKTAASKMPRVDAIGVSSAGVYINNRTMRASLFLKVPKSREGEVKDIYIRAAKEIGDVPLVVCNDGDVTALAGAMSLSDTNILGIAMGTSEAGGYVDEHGNIKGWLNEFAFAPCDGQDNGAVDEWSGDKGCGVKYFSQDSVIRLAPLVGIELENIEALADKLKRVQSLMADGDKAAEKIYRTIGVYLGHTVPYYAGFYDIKHLILLGRVVSGLGGDIILQEARRVMAEEYPDIKINLMMPDEKMRRVGQSVAAASLPKLSNK